MKAVFYYSAKQQAVQESIDGLNYSQRFFKGIPYTELTGHPPYKSNWDDAVAVHEELYLPVDLVMLDITGAVSADTTELYKDIS